MVKNGAVSFFFPQGKIKKSKISLKKLHEKCGTKKNISLNSYQTKKLFLITKKLLVEPVMSKDIKITCHTFVFQTFLLEHRCACANGCENKLSSTSMSGTSSSSSKFPVRHVYTKLYQLYLTNYILGTCSVCSLKIFLEYAKSIQQKRLCWHCGFELGDQCFRSGRYFSDVMFLPGVV